MPSAQTVPCPNCREPVSWDPARSPWRPFCSERCKLTDLGAWFSEENTIPGVELPDELIDEFRDDASSQGTSE